jgi:TRAP transporter 4TM/12TM fusion protein
LSDNEHAAGRVPHEIDPTVEQFERGRAGLGPTAAGIVAGLCILWTLFQLWLASPLPFMLNFGIVTDVPARSIHLAFGLLLAFLIYPATARGRRGGLAWTDVALAVAGAFCALYLFLGWDGIVSRRGILLTLPLAGFDVPVEALIGGAGMVILLEATRRAIGLPLVIVCVVFLLYSIFGQSMPLVISHKGLSLERLIGYQWLGGESIFGIPIDVSVDFVFLFVFFGALLDRAGAGRFFLDLAFAGVGHLRGGPAKAAILASGMTGMVSGSSIANVVTTGIFTIPVMKRTGLSAIKAGAIEVAASTNGQLMPPIMGAAAFIIAEFIGVSYFEVVKAAFIPAVIAYMALIYIAHLEALKLGLKGLPRAELPAIGPTLRRGFHYLVPLALLVYLLIVERWSASSAVFYAILCLFVIIFAQPMLGALLGNGATVAQALRKGAGDCVGGMIAGAKNMVNIAVAVAAAGIIVGAVASSGLSNALIGIMEELAGGNVYILLALTALLCLLLGMGLPTTANYLVVASLLAGVLVQLGQASGLILPLIAVHLYVFFFGLLADSTPPVCLAAFAASAISRADPMRTGVQAFFYDIRTAILPVVFIFNPQLLLIGIESVWHGALIFAVSLTAIFCFCSVTQHWMLVRNRLWESAVLLAVTVALFRPGVFMNQLYPPFAPVDPAAFVAGEIDLAPGHVVRFHVTRKTNYGDRFRLYTLATPEPGPLATQGPFGLTLAQDAQGRWLVDAFAFGQPAEAAGMDFDDIVTAIDVEQKDRPPKELVFPFAYLLLGLVFLSQRARSRPVRKTGQV